MRRNLTLVALGDYKFRRGHLSFNLHEHDGTIKCRKRCEEPGQGPGMVSEGG